MPRLISLVVEFLLPRRAARREIPLLDRGLTPNDDLNQFDELIDPGSAEPDDIVIVNPDEVVLSSGNCLLSCRSDSSIPEVLATLPGPTGALAVDASDDLLVCVGGEGLFRLTSGRVAPVVTNADGRPLGCLTAVAVADDGRIFVTDGSTANSRDEWHRDLLEKQTAGRLIEVNADDGTASVILDGLAWPYGVCQTFDGTGLLVTEAWRHRVLRFDLASGRTTVVRDDLPGYPARITRASGGTYWLGFLSLRTYLVEFILREDDFRVDMLRNVSPDYWIRPALRTTFDPWEPLQLGQLKHLSISKPWAPPRSYGLVARMDEDGVFDRSFHSRVGGVRHGTTSARQNDGLLLVACKGGMTVLSSRIES